MSSNGNSDTSKDLSRSLHSKSDRKGGLSCAECRRSKLRCDRSVPCSACVRRGCASICPDGTLTATKGNKVLQSQNEALQQAVKSMTVRLRTLEEALSAAQAKLSAQPHPLLQDNAVLQNANELLQTFESDAREEDEEVAEAFGSLSVGDQGQTRFHGQSAGSDYLHTLIPSMRQDPTAAFFSNVQDLNLPWQIVELFNAFPFGSVAYEDSARTQILQFLPPHQKALQLTLAYYDNAAYMYEPISQEDFVSNILDRLYGPLVWEHIHSHQLAVFYLIMANGIAWTAEGNDELLKQAQQYHALACASISLVPITNEATSSTIQALFVLNQYYSYTDRPGSERRWLMSGLMTRLANSMGLQRDPAVWNLSPEETQRRRILYWELYSWDSWFSVIYGRPPSLDIRYTDCRFPDDKHAIIGANGEKEQGYHAWKVRFSAVCFSEALLHIFNTKLPEHSTLLELDRRLRKFPVPPSLLCPTSGMGEPVGDRAWSDDPAKALQQYTVLCARESTLLYIHRSYFGRALKADRSNPVATKHGASVVAAFRSACLLLSGLRSLHGRHPGVASRIPFFWSSAFSSCILLGCLVFNSPGCELSKDAMLAFVQGVALYSQYGSKQSCWPFTSHILLKLHSKARAAYAGFLDGDENRVSPETDGLCPMMRVLEGAAVVINHSAKHNTSYAAPPGASGQASGSSSCGSPPDLGSACSSSTHSDSSPPLSEMETMTPSIPEQSWSTTALLATESLFTSPTNATVDPSTVGLSVDVPLVQHGLEIIPPVYPFMSTSEATHGSADRTNSVDIVNGINGSNGANGSNATNGTQFAFDESTTMNALLPQYNNDQTANFTAMLSDLLPDSLQTFYNSAITSYSKETPTDVNMLDGASQFDDAAWQTFFAGLESQNVSI